MALGMCVREVRTWAERSGHGTLGPRRLAREVVRELLPDWISARPTANSDAAKAAFRAFGTPLPQEWLREAKRTISFGNRLPMERRQELALRTHFASGDQRVKAREQLVELLSKRIAAKPRQRAGALARSRL